MICYNGLGPKKIGFKKATQGLPIWVEQVKPNFTVIVTKFGVMACEQKFGKREEGGGGDTL